MVFELHSTNKNDRLFVQPSAADSNRWDIVAWVESPDDRTPKHVQVMTNLHVEAASDLSGPRGTWFNFGKVQALGTATNSQWEFWSGFWPVSGLSASRKETGERQRFSYETPFGAWIVRNAVHLPSDKVLFQLGDDQICGFDPVAQRVALLWRGRGPVPLVENADTVLAPSKSLTD